MHLPDSEICKCHEKSYTYPEVHHCWIYFLIIKVVYYRNFYPGRSTYRVIVIKEGCILQIITFLFAAILTNIKVPCGMAQPAHTLGGR